MIGDANNKGNLTNAMKCPKSFSGKDPSGSRAVTRKAATCGAHSIVQSHRSGRTGQAVR